MTLPTNLFSVALNSWLDDLDKSWLPEPVGLPAHDAALAALAAVMPREPARRRRWFQRSEYVAPLTPMHQMNILNLPSPPPRSKQ